MTDSNPPKSAPTKALREEAALRAEVIEAVCFKPHITGHIEQFERIEALITSKVDEARLDELTKLRDAFYNESPTFSGNELTDRINMLKKQGGRYGTH
jgi:demethoxyubiquinone hydroxylase (CLK1/Coq7/Cat5 family)